jgi:YVTN family beta-propeller protein
VHFIEISLGHRGDGLVDCINIWVVDEAGTLLKLNSVGVILQTVNVGVNPRPPVFDGTNIWVPNLGSNSVTVVRASTGAVLATLTDNGLHLPNSAAFDGERILVTNTVDSVSLWKAADLTQLGSFPTGANSNPVGACSDGLNFWITLLGTDKLARF